MRFTRRLLAAACCIVVGSASIARAEVVFGNLGVSGTGALGITNTDIGPTSNDFLAQGFTAASPNLLVTSVSMGLFGVSDGTIPASVGIFTDIFGEPNSTPLYTSATVNIGDKATYSFSFSGASLTNGQSYWVRPLTDVSWYLNSPGSAPTGQNSSGYIYTNTLENIDGTGWVAAGSNRYSVSVVATVPEPSTYALAAIGLGLAGLVRARRRKATI